MSEKAIYRIIDANYNRAREGLRVMEEFCRFGLNDPGLSGRAKQLRHALCTQVDRLPGDALLCARDTCGDVGVGQSVQGQWQRRDLYDCLTAAAKRLVEALRALSECIQTFDPGLAQEIEQIRYQAYTLEKDIVTQGIPAARFAQVQLYVIITQTDRQRLLDLTEQCIVGGADCIQLRAKGLEDRALLELASAFVECCRLGQVISIINDRVDIAVASGADGVHLGLTDLSVATARQLQLTPLVIGSTTHNLTELEVACQERPTYVALGPAFATDTKPDLQPAGLDYVRQALPRLHQAGLGHCVIGGITPQSLLQVLETGAHTVAVCAAVTEADNPEDVCVSLKQAMK